MGNSPERPLSGSILRYGSWLESQDIKQLHLHENGLSSVIEFSVSWPNIEGTQEPLRPFDSFGTISPVLDANGNEQIVAEAKILRNFQELHAEARGHYNDQDVFMFPRFHAWLSEYVQQLGSQGIFYQPQLFETAFTAMESYGYDIQAYKEACVLDFMLSTDDYNSKDKHLAIGWESNGDLIPTLFNVLAADPSLWEAANIGGAYGDWDAFVQYMVIDIRESWQRVMPILVDAAAYFSVHEAPRIVFEETEKAFNNGSMDTTYISMSILGHMIDESHWFRHHMKQQMQELSQQSPFISELTNGSSSEKLRNLRPAFACLYDEPVPNAAHIVGDLQSDGSRHGRRIEFLLTQEGMCIEMNAHGNPDLISQEWESFIQEWEHSRLGGVYHFVTPSISLIDQYRGASQHIVLQVFVQDSQLTDLPRILSTFQDEFNKFETFLEEFAKRYKQ